MSNTFTAVCSIAFCVCLYLRPAFAESPQSSTSNTLTPPTGGFAVLELFTSQGCSSCPPADTVLRKFATQAREKNLRVYPISFHVDYWNYLGWKDPYSNTGATERQYAYAKAFGSTGVYTPQLVINGQEQFNGTDEARARRIVNEQTALASVAQLELSATLETGSTLKLHFRVTPQVPNSLLRIAFIAQQKENLVSRGENAGNTSSHSNVVIGFQSVPMPEAGSDTVTLNVPAGFSIKEDFLLAFVQGKKSMKISAAEVISHFR